VGKTTLLLQIAGRLLTEGWPGSNLTFFDFGDDRLLDRISPREVVDARPPGFREDRPRVLLLDEIQESLQWQRWLKGAVDDARRSDPNYRSIYVATGSSAVNLRDGAVESGQGRWDEVIIEGLSYLEHLRLAALPNEDPIEVLNRDPSIFERYLAVGGFPEHVFASDPADVLDRIRKDIIDRAILRDLRRLGIDTEKVRRLFVYLVRASGQIWQTDNRAGDLKVNPKSVEAWLDILEGTHLIHRLQDDRIHGAASDHIRAKSKIYVADHGLVAAMSTAADPLADSFIRSQVFEAVVYRHLRDFVRSRRGSLSYLRRRGRSRGGDLEIDFVIRSGSKTAAIEVTSSREVDAQKIERVREAADTIQATTRIVITGAVTPDSRRDVQIVPLHQFLRSPTESFVGWS